MVARDVPNDPILWAQGTLTQVVNEDPSEQIQPSEIVAFHGSVHHFDRFDISKVDTGEGAQAYGYGLYFAEDERVAAYYRDTIAALFNMGYGTIYRVRISASPQAFLDWDRPLHEQCGPVKRALRAIVDESWPVRDYPVGHYRPSVFYRVLAELVGGMPAASNSLRRRGIAGTKYLDTKSSFIGYGTRNFVLFDHDDVVITHKDGRLLGAMPEVPADWDR